MENAQRFRQNTYKKKVFWAKYNGECVEVSAKYIQKKAFWAKYNGRIRRGFGKIHTKKAFWAKYNEECVEVSAKYIQKKHSGQNTMENAQRFRQNTYKKKNLLGEI